MPSTTASEKFCPFHAPRVILVVGDVGLGRAVEPAEPFVLVVIGPDRLVLVPEPADFGRGTPFLGALLDRFCEAAAECKLLRADGRAEHRGALVGDRAVKLVGGIGEQLDAVLDQLFRDCIERDAGFFELGEHVFRFVDVFFQAVPRLAVVAESIERRRRHRIDRIRDRSAPRHRARRCNPCFWFRSRPTTAAAAWRLWRRAFPSARRRTAPCIPDRRAWRWRSRPCL